MTTENAVVKSLREKIQTQKKIIDDLQKTYREELQKNLDSIVKDFFDATPEIQCVHWTQYTPYWNDGDECYFSVNDICYEPTGTDEDDYESYETTNYFQKPDDIEAIKKEIAEVTFATGEFDVGSDFFKKYSYNLFTTNYDYATRNYVYSKTINESLRRSYLDGLNKTLEMAVRARDEGWDIERAEKNFKEFEAFIQDIDNDTMESVFGNHVEVFLTKEGVRTEEFSHD